VKAPLSVLHHDGWYHGEGVCERERSHDKTRRQSGERLGLNFYNNLISKKLTGFHENYLKPSRGQFMSAMTYPPPFRLHLLKVLPLPNIATPRATPSTHETLEDKPHPSHSTLLMSNAQPSPRWAIISSPLHFPLSI
jgi:hypothetical protein